jgi:hypothetical protein
MTLLSQDTVAQATLPKQTIPDDAEQEEEDQPPSL